MQNHGLSPDKFVHIPNGIDCEEINNKEKYSDKIPNYNSEGKFLIGYLGTLGIANALDYFIDAAEKLKDNHDISFVLVGQGSEKERLVKKIYDRKLQNIKIYPAVSKEQVQSVLAQFDICYVGWFKHPLYRFGISANKIFDYMLSGKPIIHGSNASNDPIKDAQCGISIPAEDVNALVEAILELKNKPQKEQKRIGDKGIKYVYTNHNYSQLAKKYESIL